MRLRCYFVCVRALFNPFFLSITQNWTSYLGVDAKKKNEHTIVLKEDSVSDNSCSEEAKSIAAAALAAVRNATATAAAASSRGKVEVSKRLDLLCFFD